MANFLPLKQYLLYCLDKLVKKYELQAPFLDVGCGTGDVSVFFAKKGWRGKAIDISEAAIQQALSNLSGIAGVRVQKQSFFDETETFRTLLVLDMLEHTTDDYRVLEKVAGCLEPGGQAVFAIPSNPRRWRWDDDFYGHVRRYTPKGIRKKLNDAGLEIVTIWDFTYPVFWMMRKVYTKLREGTKATDSEKSSEERTEMSGVKPEWQKAFWIDFISRLSWLWRILFSLQFRLFKNNTVRWGHEMIVLAKKMEAVR